MAVEDTRVWRQVQESNIGPLTKPSILRELHNVYHSGIEFDPDATLALAFTWRETKKGHIWWASVNLALIKKIKPKEKKYAAIYE